MDRLLRPCQWFPKTLRPSAGHTVRGSNKKSLEQNDPEKQEVAERITPAKDQVKKLKRHHPVECSYFTKQGNGGFRSKVSPQWLFLHRTSSRYQTGSHLFWSVSVSWTLISSSPHSIIEKNLLYGMIAKLGRLQKRRNSTCSECFSSVIWLQEFNQHRYFCLWNDLSKTGKNCLNQNSFYFCILVFHICCLKLLSQCY